LHDGQEAFAMVSYRSNQELLVNTNVRGFFQDRVNTAVINQHLETTDDALNYVVNLLVSFTYAKELFERTPDGISQKPLAFIYADAVEAPSLEARNTALKRLGDVALFISGVFPHSLNRKLVDVDYYIAMGGGAYSSLSDCIGTGYRWQAFQAVFDELSAKFAAFVDLLGEVSAHAHFNRDVNALRLYEVWIRTGSKLMERRLAEMGIIPAAGSLSRLNH
jgi:hypothetical protein